MVYGILSAALLLIGTPIAFVMGLTALFIVPSVGFKVLIAFPQRMFVGVNKFVLTAIPFFIFAGALMNHGGMTGRLVRWAQNVVGWVPGGLAMTNIFASMIFAGNSGSAQADVAALGSILVPAMKKEGYDEEFAAGVTIASAAISPIIPPSIIMIILAVVTDLSVGALFLGGVVPGVLIGLSLMGLSYYYAKKRNYPRGERPSVKEFAISLWRAIPALVGPVIILGGIATGFFTPTEAAAAAVAYAFVVGVFVYRELKLAQIPALLLETAEIYCAIMLIFATAHVLSWVITFTDVPFMIGDWVAAYATSPWQFLLLVNLLLLFIGTWMDPGAALIVLMPILLPAAVELGIEPIHFGIVVCVNLVIGMITPPVGYVLFTIAPIVKMSLEQLARGTFPFLVAELAVLLAITYVPELTLAVPRLFGFVR